MCSFWLRTHALSMMQRGTLPTHDSACCAEATVRQIYSESRAHDRSGGPGQRASSRRIAALRQRASSRRIVRRIAALCHGRSRLRQIVRCKMGSARSHTQDNFSRGSQAPKEPQRVNHSRARRKNLASSAA